MMGSQSCLLKHSRTFQVLEILRENIQDFPRCMKSGNPENDLEDDRQSNPWIFSWDLSSTANVANIGSFIAAQMRPCRHTTRQGLPKC